MVFTSGKKQKHAGGRPSSQPPSVTVVSAEDVATEPTRVNGVYTFKGRMAVRKKELRRVEYQLKKERSRLDAIILDEATDDVDKPARHGHEEARHRHRVNNSLAVQRHRARGRDAAAAALIDLITTSSRRRRRRLGANSQWGSRRRIPSPSRITTRTSTTTTWCSSPTSLGMSCRRARYVRRRCNNPAAHCSYHVSVKYLCRRHSYAKASMTRTASFWSSLRARACCTDSCTRYATRRSASMSSWMSPSRLS
jgi:hypothetical protein